MSDVTRILSQVEAGDSRAAEELLPLVYNELRQLAAAKMAHERPGNTLQATALVHEAYLRLVKRASDAPNAAAGAAMGDQQPLAAEATTAPQQWDHRGHFFAAAAEAMRRILINRARDKQREKRGGQRRRIDLESIEVALETPADDLLALDEALEQLAAEDRLSSELVKLRFFAGLSQGDAAAFLGIPRRTADRHWAFARAWLYQRLRGDPPAAAGDQENRK